MPSLTAVHAPGTARPAGHYSQAVIANGFVFVSGQLPSDATTGKPIVGTIQEQTELALGNAAKILEAAGSSLSQVVQMTIYLSRMDDWGAVNEVYARLLGDHRPTRAVVPVLPLHYGAGIEIQCVAVAPKRAGRSGRKPASKPPAGRPARRRAR